ncbi:52 kDa repressor of the inhibitor of the protein kinase-like [Aphis craccivora]|uniref:52 kDa repressor of the inhibitor of the protein kinase-like n=1 Tax=Aphis craccivora TaxID=307492 RepID=A0A6G0Z8N6_APHCR|nr:52 kDa repressor of the inhibitor of the protein kinase-like [Aphis craccivora]
MQKVYTLYPWVLVQVVQLKEIYLKENTNLTNWKPVKGHYSDDKIGKGILVRHLWMSPIMLCLFSRSYSEDFCKLIQFYLNTDKQTILAELNLWNLWYTKKITDSILKMDWRH